jgi:hypothetical protein
LEYEYVGEGTAADTLAFAVPAAALPIHAAPVNPSHLYNLISPILPTKS